MSSADLRQYAPATERNLKNIKSIHENVRYHCKLCPYTTNRARYISEPTIFEPRLKFKPWLKFFNLGLRLL